MNFWLASLKGAASLGGLEVSDASRKQTEAELQEYFRSNFTRHPPRLKAELRELLHSDSDDAAIARWVRHNAFELVMALHEAMNR